MNDDSDLLVGAGLAPPGDARPKTLISHTQNSNHRFPQIHIDKTVTTWYTFPCRPTSSDEIIKFRF